MEGIIKFFQILINAFVVLLFLFLITLLALPFFGFTPHAVVSGSMEPRLPVGSLILSKVTEPKIIKEGDIITFRISHNSVNKATHRVVMVEESSFITKGDNNKDIDVNPISFKDLIGKVVFSLPLLGFFYYFLSTLAGKIVVGGVFMLLILLSMLLDKIGNK